MAIRTRFHGEIEALDPPDEMADQHDELIAAHLRILEAQRAWAELVR